MKTGNFPNKKNDRRRRALERLDKQLKDTNDPEKKRCIKEVIGNTKTNLIDNARNTRTKINRSVLGKRAKYGK